MSQSQIITRFAPSPTGYLHIGGARTALFNWLYARHVGGKFLLRIEDTDRERSTDEAVDVIFSSLKWLGLDWDGEPVFQFARRERHARRGAPPAQPKARRITATPASRSCSRCARKRGPKGGRSAMTDAGATAIPRMRRRALQPVVRFKAPREGETIVHDIVQGDVRFKNEQLDDMVLLRSDGTPTYMLSVVVDDQDMDITHIVRGDDHLTNAGRQLQLIRALGYREPSYAHMPMILGPDGAKLSKRHGAVAAEVYRDMGYLPEAMRNYLARLGWAHGDDEIFSDRAGDPVVHARGDQQGARPARYGEAQLRQRPLHPRARRCLACRSDHRHAHAREARDYAARFPREADRRDAGDEGARQDDCRACRCEPVSPCAKAARDGREGGKDSDCGGPPSACGADRGSSRRQRLVGPRRSRRSARNFAESRGLKLGGVAQPLRAAITGTTVSPPIFDVMAVLGREESLARIADLG